MNQPKIPLIVSIIIPSHNSAKTIKRCLQSIKNQSYPFLEIIVVDNLSNDETLQIAENLGATILKEKSNPAKARNIGIEHSNGEYVLFVDSDQYLSPLVVTECIEKCVKENAEMIRVPEVFVGKKFWSVCSAVWKNHYEAVEDLYENRSLIHSEPRFFLKKRLQEVGMFDPLLVWGEDYDLYERLKRVNAKETRCTSVIYHDEGDISLKQFMQKNLRYGKSIPTFKEQSDNPIFSAMINHAFLTFIQLLKDHQHPKIIAGCAFLLGIKISSMIIGVMK